MILTCLIQSNIFALAAVLSVLGFDPAALIILDTDYDNYAFTYECQNVGVGARFSAQILSRTPSLDEGTIAKVR